VDQHWHNSVSVSWLSSYSADVVLSSGSSHDNRVDALQVRWVSEDFYCHFIAVSVSLSEFGSQMVFDITCVTLILMAL